MKKKGKTDKRERETTERGEPPRRKGRRDDVDGGCGRVRRDVAAVDQPEASTYIDDASGSSKDDRAWRTNSADGGSRAMRRLRTADDATTRTTSSSGEPGGGAVVGKTTSSDTKDAGEEQGRDASEEKRRLNCSGSGAVNDAEQRRGGALPDRLIPDETQQQWTLGCDVDEARRRDRLLVKKKKGVDFWS
ncbi:hypothetical protein Scep_003864 [Stephania cephalantha]|uniref:Uncharacterized protein n=1 Tax=Stephania cephalantha TaxID=152367 RepID=A0AAP0KTW2_9MAGN